MHLRLIGIQVVVVVFEAFCIEYSRVYGGNWCIVEYVQSITYFSDAS